MSNLTTTAIDARNAVGTALTAQEFVQQNKQTLTKSFNSVSKLVDKVPALSQDTIKTLGRTSVIAKGVLDAYKGYEDGDNGQIVGATAAVGAALAVGIIASGPVLVTTLLSIAAYEGTRYAVDQLYDYFSEDDKKDISKTDLEQALESLKDYDNDSTLDFIIKQNGLEDLTFEGSNLKKIIESHDTQQFNRLCKTVESSNMGINTDQLKAIKATADTLTAMQNYSQVPVNAENISIAAYNAATAGFF